MQRRSKISFLKSIVHEGLVINYKKEALMVLVYNILNPHGVPIYNTTNTNLSNAFKTYR